MPDTYTIHEHTVGDYRDTDYAELWAEFSSEHPVTLVHDSKTGLCCAMAHAVGQTPHMAMLEARYQLSHYIASQRTPETLTVIHPVDMP